MRIGAGRRRFTGDIVGGICGRQFLGLLDRIQHAVAPMLSMGLGYYFSTGASMADQMLAPAVFAFGLVAFGFLGLGPVTIAVDSYGPVTDNGLLNPCTSCH